MAFGKQEIIDRIDKVLERANKLVLPGMFYSGTHSESPRENLMASKIELLQTIIDLSKPNSKYAQAANKIFEKDQSFMYAIPELKGILMSLLGAYENDYLSEIGELIDADIFSDILDQAEYLKEAGYTIGSAVAAGVALEAHLRKLAVKNLIPIENNGTFEKAENLKNELYKKQIIDKTFNKSITSWLGLRNDAAHPNTSKINEGLIEPMIMGIRNLIEKYPA